MREHIRFIQRIAWHVKDFLYTTAALPFLYLMLKLPTSRGISGSLGTAVLAFLLSSPILIPFGMAGWIVSKVFRTSAVDKEIEQSCLP